MIICICNNINEEKINEMIKQGCSTFKDIQERTNVGSCCGKCKETIKQKIKDIKNKI